MRIVVLILLIFSVFSCHNTADRVVPDTSGYAYIAMDTVQLSMARVINETSGLARIRNTYWTHNDSGGQPSVYQFDPISGEIIRAVRVRGAINNDWEELTQDSTFIYIGDFGNNRGNRKNLTIYKSRISELLEEEVVDAEKITFNYPDQESFFNGYNHNHDLEAMITYGDSIYLFSKNWQNMRCKLYSLPKEPGDYTAHLISSFDSRGTITAAAISDDLKSLYLLGYNPGEGFDPFIWFISDWRDNDFLSGEKTRYNISIRQQMEAIIPANDSTLIISSEDEGDGHPSLFSITM